MGGAVEVGHVLYGRKEEAGSVDDGFKTVLFRIEVGSDADYLHILSEVCLHQTQRLGAKNKGVASICWTTVKNDTEGPFSFYVFSVRMENPPVHTGDEVVHPWVVLAVHLRHARRVGYAVKAEAVGLLYEGEYRACRIE